MAEREEEERAEKEERDAMVAAAVEAKKAKVAEEKAAREAIRAGKSSKIPTGGRGGDSKATTALKPSNTNTTDAALDMSLHYLRLLKLL